LQPRLGQSCRASPIPQVSQGWMICARHSRLDPHECAVCGRRGRDFCAGGRFWLPVPLSAVSAPFFFRLLPPPVPDGTPKGATAASLRAISFRRRRMRWLWFRDTRSSTCGVSRNEGQQTGDMAREDWAWMSIIRSSLRTCTSERADFGCGQEAPSAAHAVMRSRGDDWFAMQFALRYQLCKE